MKLLLVKNTEPITGIQTWRDKKAKLEAESRKKAEELNNV